MADIKWIKISTGLPGNKKLTQIRTLPDGDKIALMWVFLLCLAGDVNEQGLIYLTPEVPYTDEMLAEEFRMDVNIIRLGLATFRRYGMLEIVDDIICLSSWEKWQSADKLETIREKTRIRVARHREKQKQIACNVTSNANVTHGNATEEDKEIDKEEEKEKKNIHYQQIADMYNSLCPSLPSVQSLSEARKKAIRARLNKYGIEDFRKLFSMAEASDFLKGANQRNWNANFDWLIKDANMAKVLDGNYNNAAKKNSNYQPQGDMSDLDEYF